MKGPAPAIPITLVTGFLGAGKSTLINKVMADNPGRRFGLVVNEFGEVGLESQILGSGAEGMAELSNGCMCCVVRSTLRTTVEDLLARAPGIDHLILEASGLSDPVPIANTFLNDNLGGRVSFQAILCVVDALGFASALEAYPIAGTQVEYADYVLLSKSGLAPPGRPREVRGLVHGIRPGLPFLELSAGFPSDLVFETSSLDHGRLGDLEAESGLHHHVHEEVDTLLFTTQAALDPDRLGLLLKDLPLGIVRAKGFLHFSGRRAGREKYLFQLVGARVVLETRPWGRGEGRMSALVFIGRGFDKALLEARLRSCEAVLP